MATYNLTPAERRARAQAIVSTRENRISYTKYLEDKRALEEWQEAKRQEELDRESKRNSQNFLVRGLSTIGDVVANVLEGAVKGLEGIYDLGAGIVGAVGGIFSDDFQNSVKNHIAYDFAGEVIGDPLQEALRYSYLKEDGIIEGVSHGIGQLLPAVIATIATYGAYAGVGAATTAASAAGTAATTAAQAAQIASLVTMGVSAAGTGTEQAFQDGADYWKGLGYGVASGLVEVGTEKLFGGATKALTGAGIFDGVVESTAKTGFRRIAQNAVEEGVEEVVAELANPALKTIYKGADAFSEYGEADYWKGVGKSAIVGSLTALGYSGTIGYGMSKIKTKDGRRLNYVGKEADVQEVLGSLENLKAREKNLQESGTGLTEKKAKIAETTRRGYQQIETILKGVTESRRASLIKEFSLGKAFSPDGSLSTEMATRLGIGQPTTDTENGDSTTLASDVNDYNYSTSLWGREAEIETDFSAAIEDLAKTYIEEAQARGETVSLDEARAKVGRITIKKDGLEGVAMERRNKFNKALNVLNRLGHTDTSFVIVDSSELMSGEEGFSFEGFKRGDKIYIDATAFENDTWAETLVHEETHLEEGSQEYEEMVAFLQSDDLTIDDGNGGRVSLWEKAQSEVFAKKYGLSAPQIETISEKIKAGEPLTEQETKMYAKFRNELVAHETGILLGNERFIDRIISKDSSIAKQIIDKIINLKKMFQKVDMSKAEYKQLLQAERLYFRAAQRIGDIKLAKYILSRDRDFEEEVDTEGEISYNKRKGIYIDDKQEYAILAQELARKNGDISFARIFGKTGIKINMSMIPNIDKSVSRENAGLDSEGNLLWSEFGVDYDEAVTLMSQEGYSQNVGTTTIGVSDNHIRKLLANPHTNYIIPYHRSGINKLVAKMSDIDFYKDYTLQQRTRYRKNGVGAEIKYADGRDTIHPKDGRGKAVSKTEEFNFFESLQRLGDAKAMAHEYLEWCDEKGFIPKFEQFTADENYYKLLVDFRVYDAITGEAVPQVPATLTFPDNVTEIIEAELATQEIAKGKEAEVFEDTLSEIYDVIRKDSKRTEGRVFESGDESVQWSLRTKEPPKKTIKAYKVFFAKNGGLYPPMVANPNGEPTPIGVWLDADIGASAGVSKTGRPQVKAGGKGTQGGSGALAFRPGWHLGEYPKATQFNRLNPETGKKELFPKDFVWAECEIAADIDYQEEAMSYGYTENGKFRHSYAGLPKLPTDGYYQYRTNPDPSTVPWYITGAMKVTRILDDNDVREILKKFGVEPIEREGGDIDLSKYGLTHGVVDEDVEFSLTLPEDPTAKPYFYELTDGQVKKLLADYTRRKVYNKVEAEEIISTIVGSYLSFGDAYGTISGKPKAEVIDMLWRGLNTAVPGKKAKVALDVAEYIIQHSIVESIYDDPAYEIYTDTIALLKPYLHKMNLDGIKGEIRHRYDKDNSPYLLWGKRKGESGLGADVIAMELESLGFHIDAINEADIFFQIDEAYRTAVAGLKKDAKSILSDSLTTEERKQLKQDLAREILVAFDTHGHPSKLSAIIDEYAKKAQFWREKFYEERNKNKVLNRVLDKIQRIKDIKLGTFINASVYKTDIFKGSIEQLSRIKHRGNLNESGTREIIKGLLEWYNEENPMLEGQFDEDIANALRTFANGEGQITTEDLKALENIVDYFKHFIETYNKVYRNGQYVEAEPIAKKYVEIFHANKKAKVGWLRKFFEKYITTFSDPMTVMRYMDRYSDGFFTEMLGTLRQGTIGAGVMEMEMREPLEAFYKKHKKFLKSLQDKTVTYQGSDIPLSQAMLLYMSLNRDQAILGLARSGFAYTDKDGKIVRINGFATQEGLEIEEIRIRAKEVQKELASQFSEVEKEYIAIAEKLFNEDCKEAKKKTDMQLRGYTNALEDYYVPIRRYVVGQSVDTESYLDEMARVSNASFNKDTVKGAKNELYIGTLESVLDRHIRAVALYANLAMPLREYDVLYNLDISGNRNKPTSVKTEGVNAWAEGQEYFKKLVKDIQGIPASTSVLNKWLSKLRGGYAKYQLGANPKVWVTQLSSFAAAGNILDIDCIIRGIGIKASDVDEYCSLAKLRNNDNFAALAQGVMDKTGKIGDVLMKPIGMVDRLVVAKLFGACQVQVEKNGGAKVGTKENKIEAGKLLEKVILETQQNPLATERSAAMRDGSEIMKTLTMFSADSMKVFGRVIDSIGEVAVLKTKRKNATDPKEQAELDKKIKSANKKAGRAVASLVSQAVFMALIAQAFRTLYNKDDEDENIAQNMAVDAVGNLFGGLPLIRDIYSFYAEGYDLDNYAYSTVNDLLQSGKDVFDLIGSVVDGSTDSRDIALSIKKAAYAGGQLFGIPTRNVHNFVYGITKRISPSTAYKVDDKFYKQSYRADLAKAIERGDEAMIATIAELMLDENLGGLKDSKARSEMGGLIEKGFDVIPRSVQDTITYDGEEYTLTASQRKAFEKVYAVGNEAVASLVKLPQYAEATDEVKAKAINFIYSVYYNLALQDFLGVDLENKNILFAEAIDIEKLALIVATARTIVGDTDKKGKVVSGSRKKKVQAYINSLNLKAVQKYMVMGYLGYSNQYGEVQVKAYINRLSLTKSEKEKLLAYSGYSS